MDQHAAMVPVSASTSPRTASTSVCCLRVRPSPWHVTTPASSSWARGLDQAKPALVVLEATGGFEITVAAALSGAKLPLAVVNLRQIRDFARALGRL
jgi:hypothetical protein